ncbi:MAG: amidohydrolase family protein [Gammaproteobacteria bacterium]|nr:amidohydrolase family protein [Gammaproteobacteria bacterium]
MKRFMQWMSFSCLVLCANLSVAQTIAVTGGKLLTQGGAGVIENGTVLMRDGRIVAVGQHVQVPADALIIDATGKIVTPGLFDAYSEFGVTEVSGVDATVDAGQSGERFSASFDVSYAINPRSTLIGVNRIEGITRAAVVPGASWAMPGSIFSGQAAVIDLAGPGKWLTRSAAAMFVHLGESGSGLSGGSRVNAMLVLRDGLEEARDYAGHSHNWEQGAHREFTLKRKDLDALQPVLRGETLLLVAVERASDITQALQLKKDFGLKLAIVGGAEAWVVAADLAAANVPVILDPQRNLPSGFDSLGSTLENAARLQKAGVLIAISDGGTYNARNITQYAGLAVANGLPYEAALRAITLNPARIYGVNTDLGSLEVGKAADLVVWSGDPLELTSFADQVIIRGKNIPMVSRATRLRDRYMNLDEPMPLGYKK